MAMHMERLLQRSNTSPAPAGNCAATVSNSGDEDNDVNDESNSDYESKRGDEANEYNDESDSGDEANNDDLQWSTHSVDANCENLLDRVYDAVRNGQSRPMNYKGTDGTWERYMKHRASGTSWALVRSEGLQQQAVWRPGII